MMFNDLRSPSNRRSFLKCLAGGAGGMMLSPIAQAQANPPAATAPARPKRVVFFMQNQGFYPVLSRPRNVDFVRVRIQPSLYTEEEMRLDRVADLPLDGDQFPDAIAPLAPYARKVTIVQGLNARHTNPAHGAGFGALAAFRDGPTTIPSAETIDCALARALPAPFPLLSFGWQSLPAMQGSPITYCSSAWGRQQPAPSYCNPLMAHAELFGAGGAGEALQRFVNDTETLDLVSRDVRRMHERFTGAEQARLQPLVDGYDAMSRRRRQLADMADVLRRHAPQVTEKFTAPRNDLDWKEANFEVACSALTAGLTNVVTIASGCCNAGDAAGPFLSHGTRHFGHALGHTTPDNPDWTILHNYNLNLLVRMIRRLEATPEGTGNMMDNTLIVYTSDAAENQHSRGDRWPFVLIGNLGGTLRTGRYIHYPQYPHAQGRSVNALFATFLHAAGAPRERFNLAGPLRDIDRAGPMAELLV